MNILISTLASLALIPLAHAAEPQPRDHGAMHQAQPASAASASGTVRKVDAARGMLTIAHGPVPELGWPAMVMPFEASAELIGQVQAGDRIRFGFTSDGMKYRITSLER